MKTSLLRTLLIVLADLFKLESMYSIMACCFPIQCFLECCSQRVLVFVHLRDFIEPFEFFCYLSTRPSFYGLPVPIFFSKRIFFFLCIRLLVCLRVFSTDSLIENLPLFRMVPFCLSNFFQLRYPLSLPLFASIFSFFFSSSIFRLTCCYILFLSFQHILDCFFVF